MKVAAAGAAGAAAGAAGAGAAGGVPTAGAAAAHRGVTETATVTNWSPHCGLSRCSQRGLSSRQCCAGALKSPVRSASRGPRQAVPTFSQPIQTNAPVFGPESAEGTLGFVALTHVATPTHEIATLHKF